MRISVLIWTRCSKSSGGWKTGAHKICQIQNDDIRKPGAIVGGRMIIGRRDPFQSAPIVTSCGCRIVPALTAASTKNGKSSRLLRSNFLMAAIKIAVDAMGGDQAPVVEVEGAVQAAAEYGIPIVLVGQEDRIHEHLRKHDTADLPIEVVHAS